MRLRSIVLLAVLGFAALPAAAEVSVHRGDLRLQAGGTGTWAPVRTAALDASILNPFGDLRGDGQPSVAQAPVSGAWEATWALGGSRPGLAFARFDAASESWTTVRAPAARAASASAGRTVSLHHDSQGNSYLLYEDPVSGQVLLSSVARGSERVNVPLVLATPQAPGCAPDALWDGDELVIAYVRADEPDRIEVMGIVPEWDVDGRIPDGGEGIPGIPEPIFGRSTISGGLSGNDRLGTGAGAAPALDGTGAGDELSLELPPPMLRIETLPGDGLLVTWYHEGRLYWSKRNFGDWTEPAFAELDELAQFESWRESLAATFAGRIDPGAARSWDRDRPLPDGLARSLGRR